MVPLLLWFFILNPYLPSITIRSNENNAEKERIETDDLELLDDANDEVSNVAFEVSKSDCKLFRLGYQKIW